MCKPEPTSAGQRLIALTNSFPTLRGVLITWEPRFLDEWTSGPEACANARLAGQFILSVVCDRKARWRTGRSFDLHKALKVWDRTHRQAFANWALDPWYL